MPELCPVRPVVACEVNSGMRCYSGKVIPLASKEVTVLNKNKDIY